MKVIQKIAEQRVLNTVLDDLLFAELDMIPRAITPETIEFLENRIPILRSGKYELKATQKLTNPNESFSQSLTIEVESTKDKLTPQDVYHIYPPKNSVDDYHDILPHIVLNDSIFPWAKRTSLSNEMPWITLVLLDDKEINIDKTVVGGDKIVFPSSALFGESQNALTKQNCNPFLKLTTALKKIKDDVTGTVEDDNDLTKIDEKSIIICNRLPEPNKRYVVHLVSLIDANFKNKNIETTSLFNWTFQTKAEKVAFNGTIKKATRQNLQLPDIQHVQQEKIIEKLRYITNDEINQRFKPATNDHIKPVVTSTLKTAKQKAKQEVFQAYLQILVKEIISQVYDQPEGDEVLQDELIRSAFWQTINNVIQSKLSLKTENDSLSTILGIFNTEVNSKITLVKTYMFRSKFKMVLMVYFTNNEKIVNGILEKITPQNIDDLKIEDLEIPEKPNYVKLTIVFQTDKTFVFDLFNKYKDLIIKKFKNIKSDTTVESHFTNIKNKITIVDNNINYNDWIEPITKGVIVEASKANRLKPIRPMSFEKMCKNTFLRIIKHQNINELTKAGFVPLPHFMRRGTKVISMYRSPFVPVVPDQKQKFKAIHFPDELYRFFGFTQMLDATYAAAWELGRMLTLENEQVATSIYKWKRQYIIDNKKGMQYDPFGLVNQPVSPNDSPVFINTIKPWLKELVEFRNIPFSYLVPYEDMLPPNSIRTFNIDKSWLAALLDGVLSIGRIFDDEDANTREVSFSTFESIPSTEFGCGIIIRSPIVADYPDMIIHGDEKPPKMIRNLSSDIMLCTFDSSVKKLEFFLKPMGIRFGFNDKNEIESYQDIQTLLNGTKKSHEVATSLYKKSPKSIITKTN